MLKILQKQSLNFKSQPVRIRLFNDEPYFCLSDVCLVLGVNRRSTDAFRLNKKGCSKITTLTSGGQQEITFINEPNLYRIIFRSNKAEAVDFQNWVFEEVLPQIRKTGSYSQNAQQNLPLEQTFNFELKNSEVVSLTWLWFSAHRMVKFIEMIEPALKTLGSNLAPSAHSMGVEYGRHIKHIGKLIYHLSKDADFGLNQRAFTELVAEMQHQQTKRLR